MSRIPRIEVPSPVIRRIPSPQIREVPPPVVSGMAPPAVNVPNVRIDYPTMNIPEEPLPPQGGVSQQEQPTQEYQEDTRDMGDPVSQPPQPPTPTPSTAIPTQPSVNVGGMDVPLPEAAPLVTAGAAAVVTTGVALTSTIVLNKLKDSVLEPLIKRASRPKKKVKIKQVKPVLHYVLDDDGGVDIYQYSAKGTKLIHTTHEVETYLRDQVEIDSLYEYDNKIIIDDVIRPKFTKEGAKRFRSHFAPAKAIAKKLSAKFSI